jgi:hypothetical protein
MEKAGFRRWIGRRRQDGSIGDSMIKLVFQRNAQGPEARRHVIRVGSRRMGSRCQFSVAETKDCICSMASTGLPMANPWA